MPAEIAYEHAAPGLLIGLGLALAAGTVLFSARRHLPRSGLAAGLLAVRLAFLALLGWTLLLPSRRSMLDELLRPRFAVLLDTSASMLQAPELSGATNRWDAALAMLGRPWREALEPSCRVDLVPFDAEPAAPRACDVAARLAPAGRATHLRQSLSAVLARYRGQDVAGVLLLSDGIDTRERDDAWAAGDAWPAPVYAVELEASRVVEIKPDVRVDQVDTPRRAVVNWDTRLTVTVEGLSDQAFPVRLRRNGLPVEEAPVRLPADGGSQTVSFRLPHPVVGNEVWTVAVAPLPGEAQTNDNEMAVAVEVVDARNRLLYVEDVPRWESKYLNRELHANRDITPLSFVRGPGGVFLSYAERGGATLDLDERQLALYKIVILGDLDAQALGAARAAALRAFVERGGSLVLLGGAKAWGSGGLPDTELAALLPFARAAGPPLEGSFPTRWTADGRGHPALASEPNLPEALPPVLTVFGSARPGEVAVALAEAETPAGWQPIVAAQSYGQGKVLALLTDSLWRWQLQPDAARPYAFFWRRAIEWLSPRESQVERCTLELSGSAGRVYAGEEVEFSVRLSAPPGETPENPRMTCEVRTPDDRLLPLDMPAGPVRAAGREFPGHVARFAPQVPGNYRAVAFAEIRGTRVESAPFLFQVRALTQESAPRPANLRVLRDLARVSGGRCGDPDAIDRYLRSLHVEPRRERRVEHATLWQTYTVLSALLALLLLEWIARKVRSMS